MMRVTRKSCDMRRDEVAKSVGRKEEEEEEREKEEARRVFMD